MWVKVLILQAQVADRNNEPEDVVRSAEQAEDLARDLDYEPLRQRCRYWKAAGILGATLQPFDGVNTYVESDFVDILQNVSLYCTQYPEGDVAREFMTVWPINPERAKQIIRGTRNATSPESGASTPISVTSPWR